MSHTTAQDKQKLTQLTCLLHVNLHLFLIRVLMGKEGKGNNYIKEFKGVSNGILRRKQCTMQT